MHDLCGRNLRTYALRSVTYTLKQEHIRGGACNSILARGHYCWQLTLHTGVENLFPLIKNTSYVLLIKNTTFLLVHGANTDMELSYFRYSTNMYACKNIC